MTTAIEIRDRAKRLGLEKCCEECARDISLLDRLSGDGPVGAFTISRDGPKNEPVIGTTMEDAARRLRRSIGSAA
jgi:hypothetical protein